MSQTTETLQEYVSIFKKELIEGDSLDRASDLMMKISTSYNNDKERVSPEKFDNLRKNMEMVMGLSQEECESFVSEIMSDKMCGDINIKQLMGLCIGYRYAMLSNSEQK